MFRDVGIDDTRLYPRVLDRPAAIFQTPSAPSSPGTPDSGKAKSEPSQPQVIENGEIMAFNCEEQEDLADAMCKSYDQLALKWWKWWWWILEIIPQQLHYQQDDDNNWARRYV